MNIFSVNSFVTDTLLGNPAGVCLSEQNLSHDVKQQIARKLNYSETAFIYPYPLHSSRYAISWFTPEKEVHICLHATLAASHILHQEQLMSADETVTFVGKSVSIKNYLKNARPVLVSQKYPFSSIEPTKEMSAFFDFPIRYLGISYLKVFAEVSDLETLKSIQINSTLLKKLGVRALALTCRSSDSLCDYYYRYFAPIVGIEEDPACGSSHLFLGNYWQRKLQKEELVAISAYPHDPRGGGKVFIECPNQSSNMHISGHCQTHSLPNLTLTHVNPMA